MSKYASIYENQERREFECAGCGKIVRRRIDPDTVTSITVFCFACRKSNKRDRGANERDCGLRLFAREMLLNNGAGPVTTYTPEHPEFEKIAAECDLTKKEKLPHYGPFDDENCFQG